LHDAFFLELREPLLELLLPRDVFRAHHREVLRREARDAIEDDGIARGDGIADLEKTGIHEADHVAGIGALDRLPLACEEAVRPRHAHFPIQSRVVDEHVLLEDAGADAHEGQAIAMALVHVRLDLENEAREGVRGRRELELFALRVARMTRWRRWRELEQRIEERLDP